MNTFLKVLGVIFLGLIGLLIVIAIVSDDRSDNYSDTAIPYINTVVPELSTWDAEIARKYLAPEVLAATQNSDLEQSMLWLSRLGELHSFEEPEFTNATTKKSLVHESQTIVTFTLIAHYDNGDADIIMRLLEVDDGFQIYQFHINSPVLVE